MTQHPRDGGDHLYQRVIHDFAQMGLEVTDWFHPHHTGNTQGAAMTIKTAIKNEFAALIQAGQHPEEALHSVLEKHLTLVNRLDSVLREIADLSASPVGKLAFEALGMPAAEQQFVAHSGYDAASWLHSVAQQQPAQPSEPAPAA